MNYFFSCELWWWCQSAGALGHPAAAGLYLPFVLVKSCPSRVSATRPLLTLANGGYVDPELILDHISIQKYWLVWRRAMNSTEARQAHKSYAD